MKTNLKKSGKSSTNEAAAPPRSGSRRGKTLAGKATIHPAMLEIRSILVPLDFSVESEKALEYAAAFARQFGAKIILLHVVEPIAPSDFANAIPWVMENDKLVGECKRRLDQIVAQFHLEPAMVEKTLVRHGRAFNEIANAARTLKADLIILSTHGLSGLKHAFLGSTSERVVRHAPCPVLVVRRPLREFHPK